MKDQVNVRLSDAAIEKLAALSNKYGTQTAALEVAIDRLHAQEFAFDPAEDYKKLKRVIESGWKIGKGWIAPIEHFTSDECKRAEKFVLRRYGGGDVDPMFHKFDPKKGWVEK